MSAESFENAIRDFRAPSRRDEDWKYLNLKFLESRNLSLTTEPDSSSIGALNGKASVAISQDPIATLVFSNGQLVKERSTGCDTEQIFVGRVKEHELLCTLSSEGTCPFTSLNDNSFTEAACILVKGKVEKPVEIVFSGSKLDESAFVAQRLLVFCEEGAEVEIIERNVSPEGAKQTITLVSEFIAKKNAVIKHHRLQLESYDVTTISSVYIQQDESSNVASNTFSFGGGVVRNQIFPKLLGEFCNNFMRGITLTGGEQIIDTHTVIDHAVPNCESCEEFKTICGGKSQSNFAGTIIVRQDAQKTNAIQSNDSILLSENAKSRSRPQLKIWADDVRCTHGATVGELDENSLFYLRSRGIPREQAHRMLVEAFANSILEDIDSPEVEKTLRELINDRLAEIL